MADKDKKPEVKKSNPEFEQTKIIAVCPSCGARITRGGKAIFRKSRKQPDKPKPKVDQLELKSEPKQGGNDDESIWL